MNNLIHNKIREYIRLVNNGVEKRDLFANLQGYLNALLDTDYLTYNKYHRYMGYINHKFLSI